MIESTEPLKIEYGLTNCRSQQCTRLFYQPFHVIEEPKKSIDKNSTRLQFQLRCEHVKRSTTKLNGDKKKNEKKMFFCLEFNRQRTHTHTHPACSIYHMLF